MPDERSHNAVAVAEKFGLGNVSRTELDDAAAAAYAAANAVTYAAYAPYAVADANTAASAAAAAAATAAARRESLAETAGIVRSRITWQMVAGEVAP